jgi:hypothetical protein
MFFHQSQAGQESSRGDFRLSFCRLRPIAEFAGKIGVVGNKNSIRFGNRGSSSEKSVKFTGWGSLF